MIFIATGSEVSLSIKAAENLEAEGKNVRVVSFPSWEIFEKQEDEYKNTIFPKNIKAKISVEMGVGLGWQKYVGDSGKILSIEKFGSSAPDKILYEKYGFTVQHLLEEARRIL